MMSTFVSWARDRSSVVALRQIVDRTRHSLSFVPGLYVAGAIIASQVLLLVDRSIDGDSLPQVLTTTVPSSRSLFTAIAGGLITSITLLLSMMLITVQLASSQFSPRTLRNWLADRVLQHTVGVALGTTVFCLLALRATRSFGEGKGEIVPHATVIVAVVLGVASLFAVVLSVDHVTNGLRIGSVARRISNDTIRVIEQRSVLAAGQAAAAVPASGSLSTSPSAPSPGEGVALEAPESGWVQQVDTTTLVSLLPAATTAVVVVPIGGYVMKQSPLAWISPPPSDVDLARLLDGFAFGDTRTMQQDVAFGLMQLTDIAVRALSPGINDPSTANDVIVHLGDVVLRLWEQPAGDEEVVDGDRCVISRSPSHGEHLRRAFDPIRRYGCADASVVATLLRTLVSVRAEVARRDLAGPAEPLGEMIDAVASLAERSGWSPAERAEVDGIVSNDA